MTVKLPTVTSSAHDNPSSGLGIMFPCGYHRDFSALSLFSGVVSCVGLPVVLTTCPWPVALASVDDSVEKFCPTVFVLGSECSTARADSFSSASMFNFLFSLTPKREDMQVRSW